MDWEIIILSVVILGISFIINHFHWKYIHQDIQRILSISASGVHKKKEKDDSESESDISVEDDIIIKPRLYHENNHFLNYLNSFGRDNFPKVVEIDLDNIDFEDMSNFIKTLSKTDIDSLDAKDCHKIFAKLIRYNKSYFERKYHLDKYYHDGIYRYAVDQEKTDMDMLHKSLWFVIDNLRIDMDKESRETVTKAMGLFKDIMGSDIFSNLVNGESVIYNGPIASISSVKIEEVKDLNFQSQHVLTEKDQEILDEINQIETSGKNDPPRLVAADDLKMDGFTVPDLIDEIVSIKKEEKNELEKTLEESGHL